MNTTAHYRVVPGAGRILPVLLFAFAFALSSLPVPVQAEEKPVVKLGILDVFKNEAAQYTAEFLKYDPMVPVYRENNIEPSLIEYGPFYSGNANEEQIYRLLKPFHVVFLTTSYENSLKLTDALKALAPAVRGGLERYVREGGGLFVMPQGLRYPGDDDINYWNQILQGLGLAIMHEGLFDPTRAFKGKDLQPTTYWHTQNIKAHPVTEGVSRLVLPIHAAGKWPGVPAIQYSSEWQILVSGEKEAKSFQESTDNALQIDREGTYKSEPPIVGWRSIGKGRIVCYPLANIHAGMNYSIALWDNTVETRGNKEAGLPSFSLKMTMNALRWLAEPALGNPEFGAHVNPPYAEIIYPPRAEWDSTKFESAPTSGVKGIMGLVSSYAGGKGSVNDYVQAAKAAGLGFIVFADPLEKLTPETFGELMADCAAASKTPDFYACPGVEFSDGLGNRWAFWGEKVVYPETKFVGPYYKTEFQQWDGAKVRHYGQYIMMCQYSPSALLDYKQLRANGAHPENMWWFYDFIPLVYDNGELKADNYQEFLHGLSDLRWSALMSFTRITNPADVARSAGICFSGFRDSASARNGLNTRCAGFWAAWAGGQFVSQGPVIAFWNAINSQMESNWKKTRGAQRIRLKFVVRSDDGIADVKVRDADKGIFRRFIANGEKELVREFECVHDRQHDLTLEVTDTKGKRAFSWVIQAYCYKQGLFRCGDNLNILGATGMIWHPDRNEWMAMSKAFENGIHYTLFGWDSGNYLCPMPYSRGEDMMYTDQGEYPQFRKHGAVGKILDVSLSSYNLQIASQRMTHLSEPYDTETRPTPAFGTIPKDLGPLEYYERTHTIYSPATRTDWYTSWNHRRPREGIKDYRGGFIWHEGKIHFTKDVTLKNNVPIPLLRMMCPVNLEKAQGDSAIVTDASGKTRFIRLTDEKKPVNISGRIRPGGYAVLMPSLVGYEGFMAPAGSDFAYHAFFPGWMWIGLGRDGQMVKAGTEFDYRFAVGTFADSKVGNDLLEDTLSAMNFDGRTNGYPFAMKSGTFVDGPFFFTAKADKNETAFTIGPRDLIIDLPFRIEGLEDNGCAAVHSRIRPWFRFVPVVNGTAFFQEPILPANELWVGNILVCDNKDVKITVVTDGLKDGNKPFVELHNPTDKQLDVSVISPPNTPQFGGLSAKAMIPSGNTCRFEISDKKLVPIQN